MPFVLYMQIVPERVGDWRSPPLPDEGQGHQNKKASQKVRDMRPEGPAPFPSAGVSAHNVREPGDVDTGLSRTFVQLAQNVRLRLTETVQTTANAFELSRLYYGHPARIPDKHVSVEDVASCSAILQSSSREFHAMIWPYPNISAWRLGNWFWNSGDTKSRSSLKSLVNGVLLAKDFIVNDLVGVSWEAINEKLAQDREDAPFAGAGWRSCDVKIKVPTGVKKSKVKKRKGSQQTDGHAAEDPGNQGGKSFTVSGLWQRPIMPILREIFSSDPAAGCFHFEPFRHMWQANDSESPPQRVFSEVYTSDAFLSEHDKLQNSRREPGCNLLWVVAALMFWSDSTHLAQFGQAKLWPLYAFWGNQSKYKHCKPSANACHDIAYMPTVSHNIFWFHFGCG
jgi:hypothetical protein